MTMAGLDSTMTYTTAMSLEEFVLGSSLQPTYHLSEVPGKQKVEELNRAEPRHAIKEMKLSRREAGGY